MVFKNENISPLFEVSSTSSETVRTISIDSSREIRYVSMRTKWKYPYTGLRLYDESENIIVDKSWVGEGDWSPLQMVPLE